MVHWNIESYGRVFSFPPPSGLMKKAWAMQWDKDGRYVKVFGGSSLTYSRFGQPPPFPSTWIEIIIVCNCTVQHLFDANVQLQLVCTKTSSRQTRCKFDYLKKEKSNSPLIFNPSTSSCPTCSWSCPFPHLMMLCSRECPCRLKSNRNALMKAFHGLKKRFPNSWQQSIIRPTLSRLT